MDPAFIKVWSRGLRTEAFMAVCRELNTRLTAGELGKGKCRVGSDTLSLFGGTNEDLGEKLKEAFDSGKIRGREE